MKIKQLREEIIQSLANLKEDRGYIEYGDLVSLMGKTLVKCDLGSYSGDSYYLIYNHQRGYGYVGIGWGSCSGCDALEACKNNLEEIVELYFDIYNRILWQPDKEHMSEWMLSRDWILTGYGGTKFAVVVGAMLTWLGAHTELDVATEYRVGGLYGNLAVIEDNRVIS